MVLKRTYQPADRGKKFTELTDEQILGAYQATGDPDAISTLIDRYLHLVYGVCLKYLKQTERAEDASMEILGRLLNELKHHAVQNFSPWLYQVSKNHCLMILRKKDPLILTTQMDVHQLTADVFMEFEPEVHLNHKKQDILNILEMALDQLKKEQQQCLRLFYLEKRSYHEIAEITGMNEKQVKSHLQNGKRNLKNELLKNGPFNE